MTPAQTVRTWFAGPGIAALKRHPLVLVNGLAEQGESWFRNRAEWSRRFDVKVPEILVYNGDPIHRRIAADQPITVDFLTDRLQHFLEEYVCRPPYHLVGSSLGGQVLLTYAARRPEHVAKLVLLAPSGLHGEEHLPMMDGVRRSQYDTLVKSVFHHPRFASPELVSAIERKFQDRRWKRGVIHVLRGTVKHSVAPLLARVAAPTLIIWGNEDQVIGDVPGSILAAEQMPDVKQVLIPRCGHAPQIEQSRLVNQLVDRFLRDKLKSIPPMLDPARAREPGRIRPKKATAFSLF